MSKFHLKSRRTLQCGSDFKTIGKIKWKKPSLVEQAAARKKDAGRLKSPFFPLPEIEGFLQTILDTSV